MTPQQKRPPPTAEEIEENRKRCKVEIPEGMSKNQWKKLQRDKRWEETKSEYRRIQKQKRKERQLKAKENGDETSDSNNHLEKKKPIPQTQTKTNVNIIIDCQFDELMNNKEVVSLSNQIARAYSAKRHCDYDLPLTISSFNKNLKTRFDKSVANYELWKDIKFEHNDELKDLIPEQEKHNYVYLTADTDEVIDELIPGTTYIIGGIVDKNRHKNLCVNKAKELGLRVGKLPIDKYIQINGRKVLATSHVYEICCKWFENNRDWEKAFNEVLPARKLKPKVNDDQPNNQDVKEIQDQQPTKKRDDGINEQGSEQEVEVEDEEEYEEEEKEDKNEGEEKDKNDNETGN